MDSASLHQIDPGLDRDYRPRFQQLLPLLLQRRRVVQIGEPRKYSEVAMLRWLALYRWFVRTLWVGAFFLIGLGVFFARSGDGDGAVLSIAFALVAAMFAFVMKSEQYTPSRWLVLNDGLLLRSSKDRRVFFPWNAVRGFRAKYHFKWCHIAVRVEENGKEKIEWIHAQGDPLLPFLTELLDVLPNDIDREPLLKLQRKLRFVLLHSCFFRSKETNAVMATLLSIPVIVVLGKFFPAVEIGFTVWLAMMGTVLALTFGAYAIVRHRIGRRHENYLNTLLDELEQIDIDTERNACRNVLVDFGLPPRTVSEKAMRSILLSGGLGIVLPFYCVLFGFMALMFAFILFITDKAEVRYGFLPHRWEKAGEGRIVAIADSSTEKAPNGNPAPSGRDVVTLEQTLPDGRVIRCRNPGWLPGGRFQVGQKVPLLHYHGEPESLLLDDPFSYHEMYLGLGVACFFISCAVGVIGGTFWYGFSRRRHIVRLMETASVERFRIEKVGWKTTLIPLKADREPIPMPEVRSRFGETVNVFYDEDKPKNSFVADVWSPYTFDPATGEVDSIRNRSYRLFLASPFLFALGIGLIALRILLAY